MTLEISDIVKVSATITPQGVLRKEFGITLFLTNDTTLPTGPGRVGVYSSFSDVSAEFDETTEPYKAANIYFQQSPYPKNLIIGRWIDQDAPAIIYGGEVSALANIQAVSDGSLQIDGEDFTALDFSAAASYADAANVIQTALRAGSDVSLDLAEVSYDPINKRFVISTGEVVGAEASLTVASDATTGTPVSDLLGLSAAANASVFQQGANAETIQDALEAIRALNGDWYFITLDSAFNDGSEIEDISDWAAANICMLSAESNDLGVLTTGETSTVFAQLAALEPQRTFGTFSRVADYKAVSIASRFSSVNFSGNNTLITGKFKSLPGTLSDDYTPTEQSELERKNVNYYAPFSSDNIYAEGITFAPSVYIDVRYWLDWFVNAVQTDVYNLLRQSPTKVPQTKEGMAAIKDVIEKVCRTGVRNGGIAPGQLSDALQLDIQQTTGNSEFDGYLPHGYLVYADSILELSQSDRNQRKVPPFRIWLKGAGAIHFIDIQIDFEN